MSTISFAKAKQSASAPDVAPKVVAASASIKDLVPTTPKTGGTAMVAQSAQIHGEFTGRDMAIPFLNLGQKSGTLCDNHPDWPGSFVYDKTTCLGPKIKFVPCRLCKKYEEMTEFGSADIPQVFDTIATAQEAGVEFRAMAEIDILLECNGDEMVPYAMIKVDGRSYAPARYVVRSSAYGRTVGIMLKDLAGWLKNDLASGFYSATAEKRQGNGNSWFVPKLAAAGPTSESLRAAIREKFGV
jgi:hypothetical protein